MNLSIRKKLILMVLSGVLITGGLCLLVSAFSLYASGSNRIESARERMLSARKEKLQDLVRNANQIVASAYSDAHDPKKMAIRYKDKLKSVVDVAYSVVRSIDENPRLSPDQKKALALKTLKGMRYGADDYFWINDLGPRMVMHPFKPEMDGQDLSQFKDPNGKRLFVEFADVCRRDGEGFVDYLWPKPGQDRPVPKLSYVRLYKPFGWVIGSGVYMEAAEEQLKNVAKHEIAQLRYGPEKNDYFWINDMSPRMVMHPFKPELDGKDLTDYKDPNGKQLFVSMVDVCRKDGEGFVDYMWPKPGQDKPVGKISYVKLFPEWGWVVGTGVYTDDVDAAMDGIQESVTTEIRNDIAKVLGVTLLLVIGLGITGYFLSGSITKPIRTTSDILKDIAEGEGDLTRTLEVRGKDELGTMAGGFNSFVGKIRNIVGQVQIDAQTLQTSSGEMDTLSTDLSERTAHLAQRSANVAKASKVLSENMDSVAVAVEQSSTNLSTIAASTEQMTVTIKTISHNTDNASEITRLAVRETSDASAHIDELRQAALEIETVTGTITQISEQTKLLALNATIEAARAGDAGKGFAVVAGEIKELAKQTANATGEISNRIEGIQSSTKITIQEITKISQIIMQIDGIVSEIARGMDEQASAANEISRSVIEASLGMKEVGKSVSAGNAIAADISAEIESANTSTTEIAGWAEKVKTSADSLNQLSTRLASMMARFKV